MQPANSQLPGGRLPLFSVRWSITFSASEHHHLFARYLYSHCLWLQSTGICVWTTCP